MQWDTYFLAFMAGLDAASQRGRDLAYSNLIQITLARTQAGLGGGFVPNYASAVGASRDRSESQVRRFAVSRAATLGVATACCDGVGGDAT